MSVVEQQIVEIDSLPELLEELDAKGIYGVQRYRTVNGYISLKARYKDIPVSGTFELTPFCNLDCKMCYVHLNKNQLKDGERLLTVDEWKSIIKQAVEAGMMYATLTGGECLTYPGFREVYLYLVSLGIQPDVLTNGRLLTQEMIDFFAQYPPSIIQVTLYGSDEDAYESVCGHRAFREVMDGIERAKKAHLNLTLVITPSRYMQNDYKALIRLLHAQNVPYEIGGVTLQARAETEREIQDYEVDMDAYFAILAEDKKYLETAFQEGKNINRTQYIPSERSELEGLPCGGAHSSFHVNWKGELCPCIGFSATVFEDILSRSFSAAWQLIRDKMQAYMRPVECEMCELADNCISCPAEKCMSDLDGGVNLSVCRRMRRIADFAISNAD